MKKIEIFDPAMCCSTGVCGPGIDPELLRVATVVSSLQERGVSIRRHNLASEPQDFISNKTIAAVLEKEGADILPVTILDDEIIKKRAYPTNAEFAAWTEIEVADEKPETGKAPKAGGT